MLGMLGSMLPASVRLSLRLSSLSRVALVSASSLLNLNLLEGVIRELRVGVTGQLTRCLTCYVSSTNRLILLVPQC